MCANNLKLYAHRNQLRVHLIILKLYSTIPTENKYIITCKRNVALVRHFENIK